ncbi:MAG: response regulator transcription factor [Kineosporiaceae bacterium]|nr:response regulator transcription factor [Kineosporiaceae bacterium]
MGGQQPHVVGHAHTVHRAPTGDVGQEQDADRGRRRHGGDDRQQGAYLGHERGCGAAGVCRGHGIHSRQRPPPGRRRNPEDSTKIGVGGTLGRVSPHQVLVVDDEVPLARLVAGYLTKAGYEVAMCHTGPDAVTLARDVRPDVIVLDLGLPGLDGLEVCRQVRTFSDCYILMVTARDDEVDTLVGLSVGADDYVTKPFSPRELVARVQVVLRRPRSASATVPTPVAEEPARRFGALHIDVAGREVHLDGEPITLTRTEFDLLAALSQRPRFAFSRRRLVDEVWGEGWVGDDHLVDVHIGHIRRKLGDDAATPRYVRTVRGVGYRMGEG